MKIFQKYNYASFINSANFYLTLIFLFALPLKDNYIPLILVLWLFTWLVEKNFKSRLNDFRFKTLYPALAVYFVLTCLALIKSNNINDGITEVQQKLSLVFFPIIIFGFNDKIKKNIHKLLWAFVLGNVTASILCLLIVLFNTLHISENQFFIEYWTAPWYKNYSFIDLINIRANFFSYSYLSKFMHPSYFSMYLVFSIVILIYFLKTKVIAEKKIRILSFASVALFILMIYLLQSRAGIITFIIVIFFVTLNEVFALKKKLIFIIGSVIILAGIIAILKNSQFKSSLNDLRSTLSIKNIKESNDYRLQTNYATYLIIKENFWFGTSPANLESELGKKYEKLNFKYAAQEKLNSHNQYLETFAGLGILGFISLIYIIGFSIYYSIKNKNYLLFFLMIILITNFLFESMLNRMAGVLFMMFFLSLFFYSKMPVLNHITKSSNNE